MGRKYIGVRAASKTSIEIVFTYRGERCRERIKRKPAPANLKSAFRHREAILDAVANGTFDYSYTFPDSPRSVDQYSLQPNPAQESAPRTTWTGGSNGLSPN
ncbi:MAG: Arm DNA-binding domain-containing protein [Nitrososphaera sp.]